MTCSPAGFAVCSVLCCVLSCFVCLALCGMECGAVCEVWCGVCCLYWCGVVWGFYVVSLPRTVLCCVLCALWCLALLFSAVFSLLGCALDRVLHGVFVSCALCGMM